MPDRQADGAGNAVPDPRAESPHAGPPSRGFHVPPATAFLMRLPGTTSTDLGRPDRTDLRDRDEKADRSDTSFRRIGGARPQQARRPREGSFNGYFGASRTITGGTRSRWTVAVECADHPFSCAATGYPFDG